MHYDIQYKFMDTDIQNQQMAVNWPLLTVHGWKFKISNIRKFRNSNFLNLHDAYKNE